MNRRHAALTIVALVGASACSAASADVTSGADGVTVESTIASSDVSTDVTDASPTVDSTTSPIDGSTTTSDTGMSDAATTDADESTTTTDATTTTIVPVTLPERQINPVSPRDEPLQAVGTSNGDATFHAQWRLLELGFWLEDPDGRYDNTTQQAVMAFQKYYGLEADGVLGPITAEALSQVGERPQGQSNTGTLVEVDKSKQLVFIIEDGVVQWILNTSTGTEVPYDTINQNTGQPERGDSVTRTGVFNVNRERPEGWWDGDLGQIYRPKYFDGGIALHGSNYIPAYPASHGCVRLSTDAMDWIWDNDIVPRGTTVWVHGSIPA